MSHQTEYQQVDRNDFYVIFTDKNIPAGYISIALNTIVSKPSIKHIIQLTNTHTGRLLPKCDLLYSYIQWNYEILGMISLDKGSNLLRELRNTMHYQESPNQLEKHKEISTLLSYHF